MPPVLIKTVYEKNFIVVEAKSSCQECIKHCGTYGDVIQVFVEGCQTKNGILAEYAIGYLTELVKEASSDMLMAPGSETVKGLIR